MALVHLIVALALLQFFAFATAVGMAREKYNVAAPATTGNEIFERYFRVQMNTMELLIMFVPGIWMFGFYVSANVAAGLGAIYIIGRCIYFFSYVKDPRKRSLGFGLSAGPVAVLLIGALIGAAAGLLHHPM
ncbi:MAG TPA: MAPEG family protein [Steroidobacteraceae bacterium]|nr:MAPEG family protein [Steroidobacteraceae bacterium]